MAIPRTPRTAALTAAAAVGLVLLIAAAPPPGSPAPDFRLADAAGRTTQLSSLRGQVVILHFWATWCPRCLSEMPLLEEVARDRAPHGVQVLAINLAEPRRRVERYLKEQSLELKVLLDSKGSVAGKYGVVGLPASIVIDRQGRIVRQITMGSLNRREMDSLLDSLPGGTEEPKPSE